VNAPTPGAARSAGRRLGWAPRADGIASLALAAAGTCAILQSATSATSSVWWILVLGVGQSLVFSLSASLPMRDRLASAAALLAVFAAAFVPGLIETTPLAAAPAVGLAVVGSSPMWALAAGRLLGARGHTARA